MPNPYESQRLTAILRLPEVAFGVPDPLVDATPLLMIPDNGKNAAKWAPKKTDNAEDAQGNDFATEDYLEAWDVERDISAPITAEDIGYWLLALCGSVSTTQPDSGGNPLVYRHVFTLQDGNVNRQLPSKTLVEINGSLSGGIRPYNVAFPSMVMESLGLKSNGTSGRLMASIKMCGNGRKTVNSGLTTAQVIAQLPSGRTYFFTSQGTVITKDNNNTTNSIDYGAGHQLTSWGFEVDNALMKDDGYRPGSGDFQTITTPGVRQVETTTIVGSATGTGTLIWTVTAVGLGNSPKAVSVSVTSGDTPTVQAGKVVTALNADADVGAFFIASNVAGAVAITARVPAANDTTMNLALALGTATGVTAVATSTHTTAGVLQVCDVASGLVRSELLFGRRKLTISDFTVRAKDQTKELGDLLSGRAIDWQMVLIGPIISGTFNNKLVVQFPLTKYDVVELDEAGLIALKITPKPLFDTVQGFAIKFTLTNKISSYTV